MALIDRIFHEGDPEVTGVAHVANHAFSAAVWFWTKGDITRTQIVVAFGLDATDDTQLDELQAHYLSLSQQDKRAFHSDLEGAGVLAEGGYITRAQYKALLGLS